MNGLQARIIELKQENSRLLGRINVLEKQLGSVRTALLEIAAELEKLGKRNG